MAAQWWLFLQRINKFNILQPSSKWRLMCIKDHKALFGKELVANKKLEFAISQALAQKRKIQIHLSKVRAGLSFAKQSKAGQLKMANV